MKKIAIISSYDEGCGNAYFTKVLVNSISNDTTEVKCFGLNLNLTQSISSDIRKKANLHIDDICMQIADYDGVNIQLEAGLYGTMPKDIISRLKKLSSANPNTSITLHSPRLMMESSSNREVIKLLFKFKLLSACRKILDNRLKFIPIELNHQLVKFFIKKNLNLIVHTQRAKNQIENLFDYKSNVYVHPLKIVPTNHETSTSILKSIKNKYNLSSTDKIVGMFGFINEYKGHTLALKALSLLPDNYKLLFFGKQHPQTIRSNALVDKYLDKLQVEILKNKKLRDRVYFMGEYDTPDFINLAGSVDFCWLPYVENGQDGSGIASICFDVSSRILCSSSFAFDELLKLEPNHDGYNRFDIGNAVELASKTQFSDFLNKGKVDIAESYTIESQADLYRGKTLSEK
jgi:glycosyltransferase involved in cell wall biosynthesis